MDYKPNSKPEKQTFLKENIGGKILWCKHRLR